MRRPYGFSLGPPGPCDDDSDRDAEPEPRERAADREYDDLAAMTNAELRQRAGAGNRTAMLMLKRRAEGRK